ncbi:DUF3331 domain-containing protein [Paraburkholderia phenazinium]|nr:DUF3331 domain-containing protein [Paraburkholderia phenazinium]
MIEKATLDEESEDAVEFELGRCMETNNRLTVADRAPISDANSPSSFAAKPGKNRSNKVARGAHRASVKLLDRPDASTATIAWRDSTHCCYGDQVWRASRSRVKGVCAMSGRAIFPNDEVFKPRRGRASPLNAHAMILAVVLDETG